MAPRSDWSVDVPVILARIDSMDPGGAAADAAEITRIMHAAEAIATTLLARFDAVDSLAGAGAVASDAAGARLGHDVGAAADRLNPARSALEAAVGDLAASTAVRPQLIASFVAGGGSALQAAVLRAAIENTMNTVYSDPMSGRADGLTVASTARTGGGSPGAGPTVPLGGPDGSGGVRATALAAPTADPGWSPAPAMSTPTGSSAAAAPSGGSSPAGSSPAAPSSASSGSAPPGSGPPLSAPPGAAAPAGTAPSAGDAAPARGRPGGPEVIGGAFTGPATGLAAAAAGRGVPRPPLTFTPAAPATSATAGSAPGAAASGSTASGAAAPASAANQSGRAAGTSAVPPGTGRSGAREDPERRRPEYLLSTQECARLIGPLPLAGPPVLGETRQAASDAAGADPAAETGDDEDVDFTL